MKPYPQPLWMISVGHLLGQTCIALGLWAVAFGIASPYWLLLWPVTHVFDSLMLSVGLHRYFAHRSFRTSPFWHKVMAYWSIALMNGSPLGWATAHIAHHMHSDTELDPHLAVPTYLLWKRYRHVPMPVRLVRRWLRDKDVVNAHRHGTFQWVLGALAIAAVSWKLFVFGYGMALGSVHLIGGMHQVISHKDGHARNLPWLEWVLPAMGEWMHKEHHDRGGKRMGHKWWHLDVGYWFIRAIETKNKKNKEAP